jgi:hypothetical protein
MATLSALQARVQNPGRRGSLCSFVFRTDGIVRGERKTENLVLRFDSSPALQ